MASYAGSGSERGRGGRGAGQAGFSGGDTSGVGGGFEGGGGKDGLSTLSPQQQQAINDAIMADIAADLAADAAKNIPQQNVDAITGLANELGLSPRETEIAMQRAMRGANIANTMQMISPLALIGKGLGFLEDPRIAARRSMINLANIPNAGFVDGYLTAPTSKGALSQGSFGQVTYTGMPDPNYTGAYAHLVNPKPDVGGGRPEQVPPVQDPMTGEARCPAGYVFNETLQACIMDTAATSPFQPTMATAQPMPSGDYYARTGLLDQPPAGLLEAGFGTPQDFAAANTAFRMGAATRPSMYSDPYSMKGYTLLS